MLSLIYLLALSWHAFAKVPTNEERETIIKCHRKLREEVEPPASNMQLISYSEEMETLVVDLFRYCDRIFPQFDRRYNDVGIIELTSGDKVPQYRQLCKINTTISDYDEDNCQKDSLIYLRMINAATTEVGCAMGKCMGETEYILCAYNNSVLRFKSRPYEPGTPCEKCPKGYECYRNQCRNKSLIIKQLQIPQCIAKSEL
uniref:SCP domain-containing protein n=1 Tax=Mesocestoides corti TaxID=53468 RepID=A0A5K3FLV7_MESCO